MYKRQVNLVINKSNVLDYLAHKVRNYINEVRKGDLVFILCAGDDGHKKFVFPDQEELHYFQNGLYALARVKEIFPNANELKLDIYPFNEVVTKLDLYLHPQYLDNVGCDTKGSATQAGLFELSNNDAKGLLDFIDINKGILNAEELLKLSLIHI